MKEFKVKASVLPEELQDYFSGFHEVSFDSYCGECIGWGFTPMRRLGEELFEKARKYGEWVCHHTSYGTSWVLVTKRLTYNEAVKLYGEVTNLKLGPRGGFKTITFGEKTFLSRELLPSTSIENYPKGVVTYI